MGREDQKSFGVTRRRFCGFQGHAVAALFEAKEYPTPTTAQDVVLY